MRRGRTCLIPYSNAEGIEGGHVPELILLCGTVKSEVKGTNCNKLWPWCSKRFIGSVGSARCSFLYVCQMATSNCTPITMVAWDLVLAFFRATMNGDLDLEDLGASSATVSRVVHGPTGHRLNVATYSANVCSDFMTRLNSSDYQDEFLYNQEQEVHITWYLVTK